MIGADHEPNEAVILAAQWLADQREPPHPIIPHLRRQFGLTALEACEASALAANYRICRQAFA